MTNSKERQREHQAKYAKSPAGRETARRYRERNRKKLAAYRESPRGRYASHKARAKSRGIPWEFTFETWWEMWETHWHNIGQHGTSMCMCRNGDTGPYSPENCRIDTQANNTKEARWFGMMGNNTSGITGVRWRESKQKWVADVQIKGNRKSRLFTTLIDAVAWRTKALQESSDDKHSS